MNEQMKKYQKQTESSNKNKQIQKKDAQDVVIPHTCKVLDVLQADINVNTVRKVDISVACASRSHENKHTRKDHITLSTPTTSWKILFS